MSSHHFRPDVEGLRAVAVGLVLLAHAGVGAARGGYIGVDLFFVVSGYLITRLLVAELDRQGTVSLARFYARRVKRLMPQAVLAIAAVVAVAPLVLSPVRATTVAGDVAAAGLYGMNWRLSGEAVDYFSTIQDGPLDHFWSLAVEEQFYAVWPLLLLVSGRARRGAALAVGAVAASLPARAEPHSPQKRSPASLSAPQLGHARARGRPHSAQNFRPSRFAVPQLAQTATA
jgi:peptidoglycan/LPS O-acetylase OafA/YrhL